MTAIEPTSRAGTGAGAHDGAYVSAPSHSYGLRAGVLSQWETLAQSLSSIAPTAAPAMAIPIVVAVSGRSTWVAFVVATIGVVLVAAHVNVFARDSASPGSLYGFIDAECGPWAGMLTGWALLVAYIGTGAAVTGGFALYAGSLLGVPATPVADGILIAAAITLAGALAYRKVELSTRFMLWMECASVATIVVLFLVPGHAHGLEWDSSQWGAPVIAGAPIRAGLVLATFAFVGFESATALGTEARDAFRTIPRAVLGTALLSGAFFVFCAYAEVGTAGRELAGLTGSQAPLQFLADRKGIPWVGPFVAVGAVISFFACTMASMTAAARTALLMGRRGLLPSVLHRTHAHHQTPHAAVLIASLAIAVPAIGLVAFRVSAFDLFGWLGTIATYGFMTAYLAIVIAAPLRQWRRGTLRPWRVALSLVAFAFLGVSLVGSINPGAMPDRWFPVIYVGLMAAGCGSGALRLRSRPRARPAATTS